MSYRYHDLEDFCVCIFSFKFKQVQKEKKMKKRKQKKNYKQNNKTKKNSLCFAESIIIISTAIVDYSVGDQTYKRELVFKKKDMDRLVLCLQQK